MFTLVKCYNKTFYYEQTKDLQEMLSVCIIFSQTKAMMLRLCSYVKQILLSLSGQLF